MNLSDEVIIPVPRQKVWEGLNDPDVLKQCIPGCEEIEKTSPTEFMAKVTAKVGPVKARFTGKVSMTDLDPPNGYRISGEGQGGAAGFAKGMRPVATWKWTAADPTPIRVGPLLVPWAAMPWQLEQPSRNNFLPLRIWVASCSADCASVAEAPDRRSACEMLSVIVSASFCSPPSIRTACWSLPTICPGRQQMRFWNSLRVVVLS